jgi:hypothetical protein
MRRRNCTSVQTPSRDAALRRSNYSTVLSGGRLLAALLLAATAGMPLGVRADGPTNGAAAAAPVARPAGEVAVLRRLAGHWACVDAHGKRTERSYVFEPPFLGGGYPLVGRETLRSDRDSVTFALEAFRWEADGIHAATLEGVSAGTNIGEATLEFLGTDETNDKAFTLTYTVDGNVLRRTADEAGTTNDERCTAEPPVVTPQPCTARDRPARTLVAADPPFVKDVYLGRVAGVVQVAVTLDDRSDLVSAKIYSSPSALLNAAALEAARDTSYQTAVHNCRAVAQTYIFSVAFDPPS